MRTYYVGPIPPLQIVNAPAFNTFTTFQSIGGASSTWASNAVPANFLEVGTQIEVKADGEFSCTTGVTLGLGFLLGSTQLAVGTAIATGTTPTAWPWRSEWSGTVRATGTVGSVWGQGWWTLGTSLAVFSASQVMPVTQALRTVAIDTTTAQALVPGAVYGTSAAGNTITCNRISVLISS